MTFNACVRFSTRLSTLCRVPRWGVSRVKVYRQNASPFASDDSPLPVVANENVVAPVILQGSGILALDRLQFQGQGSNGPPVRQINVLFQRGVSVGIVMLPAPR